MAELSKRGAQNVATYVGHLPVSLTEVVDDSNWIDLSFAENYTIRKDVLEVFHDTVISQMTDKVIMGEKSRPLYRGFANTSARTSTGHMDSGAIMDF